MSSAVANDFRGSVFIRGQRILRTFLYTPIIFFTYRDGVHDSVVPTPDRGVLQPLATLLALLFARAGAHTFVMKEVHHPNIDEINH